MRRSFIIAAIAASVLYVFALFASGWIFMLLWNLSIALVDGPTITLLQGVLAMAVGWVLLDVLKDWMTN